MVHDRTLLFAAALGVGVALCGCSLDPNQAKVKKSVTGWANAVNRADWDGIQRLMATDFALQLPGGSAATNPQGQFINAFRGFKSRRGFYVDAVQVAKEEKNRYAAEVTARMNTARLAYTWDMRQTWTRTGGDWKLAAVEVRRQSKSPVAPAGSSGGSAVAGAPSRPPPPPPGAEYHADPTSRATGGTIMGEVGAGIDYAIGNTQLRAKRNMTNKIDRINQRSNERTQTILEQ